VAGLSNAQRHLFLYVAEFLVFTNKADVADEIVSYDHRRT
jgi:hypothetical protein